MRRQAGPCFAREQVETERGAVDAKHQRAADGAAECHQRRAPGVQRQQRARDAARHRGVDLRGERSGPASARVLTAAAPRRGRGAHQAAFAVANALQLLQRGAVDGKKDAYSSGHWRRREEALVSRTTRRGAGAPKPAVVNTARLVCARNCATDVNATEMPRAGAQCMLPLVARGASGAAAHQRERERVARQACAILRDVSCGAEGCFPFSRAALAALGSSIDKSANAPAALLSRTPA